MLKASPSRLATFQQCQKRYRWKYVERQKPPEKPFQPSLEVGRLVHEALRAFYLELNSQQRTVDRLIDRFQKKLSSIEGQLAEAYPFWEEKVKEMALKMAKCVDFRRDPFHLEKMLQAPLFEDVALWGRLDRVDLEQAELILIDYKTGKVPPIHFPDFQAPIYAYLARAHFKLPVREVRYIYLSEGRIINKEVSINREMKNIYRVIQAMQQERVFLPHPAKHCNYCEYLSLCREGQSYLETR